jgi:glycosyltransferase involved in cell wall biosynthesis
MGPKVSVGLPVRNGEATLHAAISSLLAQDFTDFELIISDNASTDHTEEICRSFDDPRIRYIRQPRDLGWCGNFRFVLEVARAPYFAWGASDDTWTPGFLSDNVAVLDARPTVATSMGAVIMGDETNPRRLGNFPISGGHHSRAHAILLCPGENCRGYGVFRTAQIKASIVPGQFIAWDWTNMIRLARFGDFHVAPRLHMIRGAAGASRRQDYNGMFLFLRGLNAWLWTELGLRGIIRCLPGILLQNAKFNRAWLTIRRAQRALTQHRYTPADTLPQQCASESRGSDRPKPGSLRLPQS